MRRYHRQMILPNFGAEGQSKLQKSRVLVIGAGGLGVPVLQYLTAAGVGHIGILDHDQIDITNLHRQVLYTEAEVGQSKAAIAHKKMQELNSEIHIEAFHTSIASENAEELIDAYDIVVDCTDNFPTRYLVNDACFLFSKPLIYGAIYRWEGQVSVFNHKGSANYRDLFPNPPKPDEVPNCEEGGVVGVLPGIIGSMMANECIKLITGIGEVLTDQLLMYDAKYGSTQKIKFKKRKDNPLSGEHPTIHELIDYEEFCGLKNDAEPQGKVITVKEIKEWISSEKEFQLIDVREKDEYNVHNIGGLNLPLSKIKSLTHEIEDDVPVLLICQSGKRSMSVLQFLEKEHEFDNLWSLEGGINGWE